MERSAHLLSSWIPGPLGMIIRSIFYKPLLNAKSKLPFVEAKTELFHMNSIRFGKSVYVDKQCRLHASRAAIELGDNNRVMKGASLITYVSNAKKGEGIITGTKCWIGINAILNSGLGGIFIGDNTAIGPNVSIIAIQGEDRQTADSSGNQTMIHSGKPIHIGKNVKIYSNAVVVGGVSIGDNAVVAAGSFVTKDVAPSTLVGSLNNIARPISKIK